MVITYSYFDYIVVHNSRWCDFWPMVHRLCDIWFFDTMKSYDVGFIGLLHVVFGIAWCCNLQILRRCMICVQCLCWFKSVFRFRWILFFLKNRWVSGHMRWGIAFRPRWKSPPFGMFHPSSSLNHLSWWDSFCDPHSRTSWNLHSSID